MVFRHCYTDPLCCFDGPQVENALLSAAYGVPSVSEIRKVYALFTEGTNTITKSICTVTNCQKVRLLLQKLHAIEVCVFLQKQFGNCVFTFTIVGLHALYKNHMLMTLRYWHHQDQVWLLCWNSVRVFRGHMTFCSAFQKQNI